MILRNNNNTREKSWLISVSKVRYKYESSDEIQICIMERDVGDGT
jgi:hypothetical protein